MAADSYESYKRFCNSVGSPVLSEEDWEKHRNRTFIPYAPGTVARDRNELKQMYKAIEKNPASNSTPRVTQNQ